jgi:hypothetical protein
MNRFAKKSIKACEVGALEGMEEPAPKSRTVFSGCIRLTTLWTLSTNSPPFDLGNRGLPRTDLATLESKGGVNSQTATQDSRTSGFPAANLSAPGC